MESLFNLGFMDYLDGLEDPRSERNRLYTMAEIFLVTFTAIISGADGWIDIEEFGKAKIDYFKRFLPYKNGIPSDDTLRRFFRALDPKSFEEMFALWVQDTLQDMFGTTIAIDGKTLRGSRNNEDKALHMVSAYATSLRMVLCQEKVHEKSNEITAIPELLKRISIAGNIITIDAMGCQTSIANKIKEKDGDFVFALKGNHGDLLDDVSTYLLDGKMLKKCEQYTQVEKGHGRIETRTCWVSTKIDWLTKRHPKWSTIASIIRIDSTREINNVITTESRFYISSKPDFSAEKALITVRSHWLIENSLHWVLDVSFGEDNSRIRKENAPQIVAIMRHIALNFLQNYKSHHPRTSIKRLRKMAGWDYGVLDAILSQKFS